MPEDDSLTHKQDLLTHKRDLLTHKKRLMKCLRTEVGQLLFDSLCASGSILCFLVIKCFFITKKLQRCNNVDGCQWWASTVSQASSGSSSSSIFAVNIVVSDGQANFCFCKNNKRIIIIVVSDEQAPSLCYGENPRLSLATCDTCPATWLPLYERLLKHRQTSDEPYSGKKHYKNAVST